MVPEAARSPVVIALDLGTTAIKAGLLDENAVLHGVISRPAPSLTSPAPLRTNESGRYEGDALAYARAADGVLQATRAAHAVVSLGLCSQRSSFLVWRRIDGEPVTPLISWQDTRGARSCVELRRYAPRIEALTGLRLTPYYFAPKLRVLLVEQPDLRSGLECGELLAGTLDTYLIWRWSGGRAYMMDASMAARTLLMDLATRRWSPELCALFSIPEAILPEITPSTGLNVTLDNGLTLRAVLGDQSAAYLAGVGRDTADVMVNLGSGGFVLRALAPDETALPGYLRTLICDDGGPDARVAMEGTLNSLAAALAPYSAEEVETQELAQNDIYCLSEPNGIGAPYFREDLGLIFSAPVGHLAQRVVAGLLLEGIIFRVANMLDAFQRVSPIGRILLSGGLSHLAPLREGIALCAPAPVYLLSEQDASLLGAALAAAGNREARAAMRAVVPDADGKALRGKFVRWQYWLAARLQGG